MWLVSWPILDFNELNTDICLQTLSRQPPSRNKLPISTIPATCVLPVCQLVILWLSLRASSAWCRITPLFPVRTKSGREEGLHLWYFGVQSIFCQVLSAKRMSDDVRKGRLLFICQIFLENFFLPSAVLCTRECWCYSFLGYHDAVVDDPRLDVSLMTVMVSLIYRAVLTSIQSSHFCPCHLVTFIILPHMLVLMQLLPTSQIKITLNSTIMAFHSRNPILTPRQGRETDTRRIKDT